MVVVRSKALSIGSAKAAKKSKGQTQKVRRWVVKAGSQMVCAGGPLLIRAWMQQVAHLRRYHHIEIIWVTSGAIASAVERTEFEKPEKTLPEKQALSAIGQPMVQEVYNLSLQAVGLLGAQVLLTAGDIQDPVRRKNLQNTLTQLLEWKAVPVLNENDAVATEEIKFGDNDSLSSQIARMMKAERLVLLTDVDGLYDRDPKKDASAELIAYRKRVTDEDIKLADRKVRSSRGTGGMYSKLLAARTASEARIITHLVKGDRPNVLLDLVQGHAIGTQIGGQPNGRAK
jgi:glutamate 5-kinase